jgi:hypothetical protein
MKPLFAWELFPASDSKFLASVVRLQKNLTQPTHATHFQISGFQFFNA